MSTPAVSMGTPGSTRNNYNEFVGYKITVGAAPLYVTHVGRWKVAGNSGTHTVTIVAAATGVAVPNGTGTVDVSGGSAGAFVYAALAATAVLAAGASYYVGQKVLAGSDEWLNTNTTLAPSADLTVVGSAYDAGGWATDQIGGYGYGPPNFLYDLSPPGGGGSGLLRAMVAAGPFAH